MFVKKKIMDKVFGIWWRLRYIDRRMEKVRILTAVAADMKIYYHFSN